METLMLFKASDPSSRRSFHTLISAVSSKSNHDIKNALTGLWQITKTFFQITQLRKQGNNSLQNSSQSFNKLQRLCYQVEECSSIFRDPYLYYAPLSKKSLLHESKLNIYRSLHVNFYVVWDKTVSNLCI